MNWLGWISALLVLGGAGFFFAGTIGMLRFPDVYTRLHAVAKADNLGLGLVVAGLMLREEAWAGMLKLLLVWLLALLASATACYLVANSALSSGTAPLLGPDMRRKP
jgi:multicomponent Na+:H+ antiporter subunit G